MLIFSHECNFVGFFELYLPSFGSVSAASMASVGHAYTHNFTKSVEGRYVTLSLPGKTRILSLCEVEVYGYPVPTGENQQS